MGDSNNRSPIACTTCARLKTKCDRKVPCSSCAAKRIQCQARWSRRSGEGTSQHKANKQDNQQRGSAHRHFVIQGNGNSPVVPQPALSTQATQWSTYTNTGNFAGLSSRATTLPTPSNSEYNAFLNDVDAEFDCFPPDFMQIDGASQTLSDFDFDFQLDPSSLQHASVERAIQANEYATLAAGQTSMQTLTLADCDALANPLSTLSSSRTRNASSVSLNSPRHLPLSSSSSTSSLRQSHAGSRANLASMNLPYRSCKIDSGRIDYHNIYDQDVALTVQDSWSHFRCNPPLDGAPTVRTAEIHLRGLARTLMDQEKWETWSRADDLDPQFGSHIETEPLLGQTRDKLLSVTQTILQRAFDVHKIKASSGSYEDFDTNSQLPDFGDNRPDPCIILPPAHMLEYFLRCYVSRIEPYYPSICGGKLRPNELMKFKNPFTQTLLLLLMMALGNIGTSTPEARHLTSGLTEACRISLHEATERNAESKSDPIVLRSALLFIVLAAWSGDRWHMDIAIDQRGMYLSMLSHSGMMGARGFNLSASECRMNPEAAWKAWKDHECRNRAVYSWVMVDLELSLFNDVASLLSISDLNVPTPENEGLWQATTASEWLRVFNSIYPGTAHKPTPSLCELFRRLTAEDVVSERSQLSPMQLRLLLHPLQTLVHHGRQFLRCVNQGDSHRKLSRTRTGHRMRGKLEEVQTLLRQWYALVRQKSNESSQACPHTCVDLMLYHLITLNTLTCFTNIAKLACQGSGPSKSPWLLFHCVDEAEEVLFHCGQVLRLLRLLPGPVRPPWWAAAVYRVALITWASSLAHLRGRFPMGDGGTANAISREPFLIDRVLPDHPSVERYCKYQEGEPMLMGPHGNALSLRMPENALRYCIALLNEDLAMAFTVGIRNRLGRLLERRLNGES